MSHSTVKVMWRGWNKSFKSHPKLGLQHMIPGLQGEWPLWPVPDGK